MIIVAEYRNTPKIVHGELRYAATQPGMHPFSPLQLCNMPILAKINLFSTPKKPSEQGLLRYYCKIHSLNYFTMKNVQFAFGLMIFAALFALSFRFDPTGIEFLVATPMNGWIWGILIGATLLLLFSKTAFRKKHLFALGTLYLLVPFSFYFSQQNDLQFIILQDNVKLACWMWVIAAISWGMYFSSENQFQENS